MSGEVCIKNGNGTKKIAPVWVIALVGLGWTILTAALTLSANYGSQKTDIKNNKVEIVEIKKTISESSEKYARAIEDMNRNIIVIAKQLDISKSELYGVDE